MRKIIAFNGSPRKDGFTSTLMGEVLRGAVSQDASVKEYDLNDPGIRPCQGCLYCRKHEGCSIKDDILAPMYADIRDADGILFGSPIYFHQVTGQSKIWLDRLFPVVYGRDFQPRYPGKRAVTLFVHGTPEQDRYAAVVNAFNRNFNMFGWDLVDNIILDGTNLPNRLTEAVLSRAFTAGEKLAGV